jgi:signal peptidase II
MCITSAAVMIMVLAVVKNLGIGGERYGEEPSPPAAEVEVGEGPRREGEDA